MSKPNRTAVRLTSCLNMKTGSLCSCSVSSALKLIFSLSAFQTHAGLQWGSGKDGAEYYVSATAQRWSLKSPTITALSVGREAEPKEL